MSALESFTESWLIPHLSDFERAHPGIELQVEATLRYADFERDPVDVAIRFGTGTVGRSAQRADRRPDVLPRVQPALLGDGSPLREPGDLRSHTIIHVSQTPDAWSEWLRQAGVPGLRPRRSVTYDHLSIALSAAESGHGVALSSEFLCAQRLAAGRLCAPFEVRARSASTYHLVCRPEGLDDPRIVALRDWLVEALREAERLRRRATARAEKSFATAPRALGSCGAMRQLTCSAPNTIEWQDVPAPRLQGDGEALVRPLAVARCDIDLFLTSGLFPSRGPFALGHECVAEILELGDAVRGLEVGQRVVVAFQVSCGTCGSCAAGPYRELRPLSGALRLRHAAALGHRVRRHALGRRPRPARAGDARAGRAGARLGRARQRVRQRARRLSRRRPASRGPARGRRADRVSRSEERPALRGTGGARARRRASRLRQRRRRGAGARRAARRAAGSHRLREA